MLGRLLGRVEAGSQGDQLHSSLHLELAKYPGHIVSYRAPGEVQPLSYLGVGKPFGYPLEDLGLPSSQRLQFGGPTNPRLVGMAFDRRRVMTGERRAPPSLTIRTAATSCCLGTSLRRNPLAPAFIDMYTFSSRSKVVNTRTRAELSAVESGRRG